MILLRYGLEPEMIESQMAKAQRHEIFKNKFTKDNFEGEKKKSLQNWLELYKQRLEQEVEKIKKMKMDVDAINLPEMNIDRLSENVYSDRLKTITQIPLNDLQSIVLSMENFHVFKKSYMDKLNPKFILRNHIAQAIIEKAENGNYEDLNKILNILLTPFDEHTDEVFEGFYDTSMLLAYEVCVSCSS